MTSPFHRRDLLKGLAATGAAAAFPTLLRGDEPAKSDAAAPVEIALVGCAHIHTPGFRGMAKSRRDVKVKYVYDHDAARAEMNAKDLGAAVVPSAETIWADPAIAAVVIFSETDRHAELIRAAANAKKAMFVEKPLAADSKQSDEMAATIVEAGVPFTTGYFSRGNPNYLFLKEQVEKGNFGKVTRVFAANCHDGSLGGWFDKEWRWMADPKIAGVGAFGDLGTHLLDILMWIFGDLDSVAAEIKPVTGRYGDCDETGESLMAFRSGVIGTLAAGWVDVANPVEFMISGTEGQATIFRDKLYFVSKKVAGADGGKPWTALPAALPHPIHQFLDTVVGKAKHPLVAPREAAARVRAMEAMYQAAKEKKWVKV